MRVSRIFPAFFVAFFLVVTQAHATELDLATAIHYAIERNPKLLSVREKLNEARAHYPQAIGSALPSIQASASAAYKKDFASSPSAFFGGDPYNFYSVSLEARQPLWRSGAILGAVRQIQRERDIQELNLRIAERDLIVEVVTAFYDVQVAQRSLESMTRTESVEREFLAIMERRFKVGAERQLDVLQSRTRLAMLAPDVAKAKTSLKNAAARLASVVMETGSDELRVKGGLPTPDVDKLNESMKGAPEMLWEADRVERQRQQLEAMRSIAMAKHLPSVDVVGNVGRSATKTPDVFDSANTSWSLSLQLSVPIFSGLSSVFERQAFTAQEGALVAEDQKVRQEIALKRVQAEADIEMGRTVIRANEAALEHASKALQYARSTYPLGTSSYTQFSEAQKNYLSADLSLVRARYDYLLAIARLYVARGWDFDKLVTAL